MMDASLDIKFTENTEAIVAQFGFKDLKSFVKNQALLLLMAKIEKYEAENRRFETKHNMPFAMFQEKLETMLNDEVFEQEEDYLDWRFAREVMERLKRQKQELENA
jgi:hypothetical protein